MKNYRKKRNEICWRCCFKPCAVRFVNNNYFAAAEGFKAGYEKVFDDTKVMVEDEGAEDIEYEEDFISENENIIFL